MTYIDHHSLSPSSMHLQATKAQSALSYIQEQFVRSLSVKRVGGNSEQIRRDFAAATKERV